MRVAVAVPNAMHAVNVSFSVSTMSVFAALLTASTAPQRPTAAPPSPRRCGVELARRAREEAEADHHDDRGRGRGDGERRGSTT